MKQLPSPARGGGKEMRAKFCGPGQASREEEGHLVGCLVMVGTGIMGAQIKQRMSTL